MENSRDIRGVFEIRLLATALLAEYEKTRERVFNSNCFISNIGKNFFEKFKAVYQKEPNADYFSFLNVLTKEEQAVMIAALQGAVSQTVDEERIESTLKNLKQAALEEKLKDGLFELLVSDFNRQGVQNLLEETEYKDNNIDSLEKYLSEYEEPLELIPTGFCELDTKLNGGFIKGTLISIGARPSTGKTTYAINIAAHNPNLKILFFSLEMSSRMIYDRLLADTADINYSNTGKHKVNLETVKTVLSKYKNLTVIDDVSEIEKIIDITYSLNPELVIIDYVQIIQSQNKFVDNRQRVDYISQMLKRTAKKTRSCIINLSQLTRGAKEKPTMSALKESGGLEQDSDYIILIHRPFVNDKSNEDIKPSETTVILDKNKFGDTGELEYNFDGAKQRFTEVNSEPVAHMAQSDKEDELDENGDLPF